MVGDFGMEIGITLASALLIISPPCPRVAEVALEPPERARSPRPTAARDRARPLSDGLLHQERAVIDTSSRQ
jgi:hypothetical protein